jgi:PQQ-like domain
MTMTDRDRLIRAALMPPADLTVPADLGEQIHARLVETPQRRPGLTRYVGPFRRLIPETPIVPRPAVVWLTALLLVLLALLAVIGVASRLQDGTPLSMTSYHGGPAQDGIMPGPGPAGVSKILRGIELPGPMDNLSVPLVRDGVVYFADTRGGIAARGATDLSEIWTVSDLPNGAEAPILLGSVLVVAGLDGTVTGLGAATGDERWKQKLDATVRGPLGGSDDRVVVGSIGRNGLRPLICRRAGRSRARRTGTRPAQPGDRRRDRLCRRRQRGRDGVRPRYWRGAMDP